MKKIAVFGSTGSIGTQTLSVAGFHPDEFEVYAIAANKNAEQVVRSANEFHPKFIGMYDEAAAREVSERCPGITVVSGGEVNSLAALSEVDIVVNAFRTPCRKNRCACKQRKHCLRTRCCGPHSRRIRRKNTSY